MINILKTEIFDKLLKLGVDEEYACILDGRVDTALMILDIRTELIKCLRYKGLRELRKLVFKMIDFEYKSGFIVCDESHFICNDYIRAIVEKFYLNVI